MKLCELYTSLDTLKLGSRSVFYDSLKTALKSCLIREFPEGDERPCQETDFADFRAENELNIYQLKLIWEDLIRTEYFKQHACHSKQIKSNSKESCGPGIDDEILALTLIICGENITCGPWNTNSTVENAFEILDMILDLYKCSNLSEILVGILFLSFVLKKYLRIIPLTTELNQEHLLLRHLFFTSFGVTQILKTMMHVSECHTRSLFKDILINLRPRLLPNTWKHYPASVGCYKWIIRKVEQPNLSPFLHLVLPTALILVDDFVTENKIMGITCLHHVIDNVTIAELKYYGHGDVIYNALESLLRSREAELVKISLPCIICLVSKLETNFGEKEEIKWSKFDEVLEIYLENMELEHLLALRETYIQNLPHLIKSSGLRIIRWSRKILKIFKEYLEVACNHNDMETLNCCLKALEIYLQNSRPVILLYLNVILFALLKTLYHLLNIEEDTNQKRNKELAIQCMKIILEQLPTEDKEKLKDELTEKLGKSGQSQFLTFLKSIIC